MFEEGVKERRCACGEKIIETIPVKVPSVGLEFVLNDDKNSYCLSSLGTCIDADIIIPDKYNGLPVTRIGSHAFAWSSYDISVTSVYIPESVTSIGESAFWYCFDLSEISLHQYINYIGEGAFGCTGMTVSDSIKLDVSNPYYYFDGNCLIEKATGALIAGFSDSVIPSDGSVKSIAAAAFAGCEDLTYLVIPGSVTTIGSSAFYCCGDLETIVFSEGLLSIGYNCFNACSNLSVITIPNSVTQISSSAFTWCSGIKKVVIGSGVTDIGDGAFFNCRSLEMIEVDSNNSFYKSIDGNLYSEDGTVLLRYASGKKNKAFIIPSFVTTIGYGAFSSSISLDEITIPNSVTIIKGYAFYNCTSLRRISIPSSVKNIDREAFGQCSSLTSVTFENTVGWGHMPYFGSNDRTSFSVSDISNTAKAAEYLTSIYTNVYWNCTN